MRKTTNATSRHNGCILPNGRDGTRPSNASAKNQLRIPMGKNSAILARRGRVVTSKKAAFTLMEVLIVLVIITILAGVVGLNLLRKPGEARVSAAKMQIKTLQAAVNLYYTEQHNYPTQAQGLEALVKKPTSEPQPANYPAGGYLESRQMPKDPWGNPYIYLCPGRRGEPFEIFSYGPDGESSLDKGRGEISSSDL